MTNTTKQFLGNIKGPKGDKGETGNGIASIVPGTPSVNESTGVTTTPYTIVFTDENTDNVNFEIKSGEKGATGAQGPVGPQGEPFQIKEIYSTIAEMNSDKANVSKGTYVMITTANGPEDEDNAKLYVKGDTDFEFITDFSGAQGIQGIGVKKIESDGIVSGTAGEGATRQMSIYLTNDENDEHPIQFQVQDGLKGNTGATGPRGYGISDIEKTNTNGLVDTYTITLDDESTETFEVTNGAQGLQGVPGLIPFITIDDEEGDTEGTGNLYVQYMTPEQYAQAISQQNSNSQG